MKPVSNISGFFKRTGKYFGWGTQKNGFQDFAAVFDAFQKTLSLNNRVLEMIADMGDKLSGEYVFDMNYVQSASRDISKLVYELAFNLNAIAPGKYPDLVEAVQRISRDIENELTGSARIPQSDYTLPYHRIDRDWEEIVGAKNANLAEIRNVMKLPVPEGFAITASAFDTFMRDNRIGDRIKEILNSRQQKELSPEQASSQIQSLILGGKIPPRVEKAVSRAVHQLSRNTGRQKLRLAIRSSAWKEDSKDSFAGQHATLLNQAPESLLNGYKTILASAYSSSAVEYRRQKGFSLNDIVVAVGCQTMINARVSGVLYTVDPVDPSSGYLLATSAWGLGSPVVDGTMAVDRFRIDRHGPHQEMALEIADKRVKLTMSPGAGTAYQPVEPELRNRASLDRVQIQQLAEAGLMIERHFKSPQDIEFAFDRDGRLFILQSRQLILEINEPRSLPNLPDVLKKYPVCFEGKGDIAQRGIGIGRVFIIHRDEDLDAFPAGSILVAKYTSPRFAKIIGKANGIITDVGSATGHMATIAREFRVPALVNTGVATRLLPHGSEITLDAEEKRVYFGKVMELEDYHLSEEPIEEAFEYRLLRRVLKKIGVLNLLDPTAQNFTPQGCRTLHDITRFVHEKAVEELIHQNYDHSSDDKTTSGKLKLPLPLDLIVIDINNGLSVTPKDALIEPNQIDSLPMRAFVDGLCMPGAWNTEPLTVDFSSFMSSLTRTFSPGLAAPQHIGQNLAVISKPYAHISLRLGYHFNMIDAYVCDDINSNYAYFRFLGGVTDLTRRSRRANLLSEILLQNDFRVEMRGDLVVARIKKLTAERMLEKIYLLGVLVAFSRQLDVQMASDQHVHLYGDKFYELVHSDHNTTTWG